MTTFISFARRQNPDSSTDSIYTRCYQTIATGASKTTLRRSKRTTPAMSTESSTINTA
jgi:hypothetical protein